MELAEFIMQQGKNPANDLEQLWRRIVFSVCISNVDDHLRNHGFILQEQGWILSPAFDLNPEPHGNGLKLNISGSDNAQDLSLVKEVAEYFRLKPLRADQIIEEIITVVRTWREEANAIGMSLTEQERMARAFRVADE